MTLDLVILFGYAIGLLLIGWYSLRRARSREDYLVAGRRLGPVMYAATLSTVVLGGASTVGTVRLGYVYGLSGLWFCTLLGLGILVISLFLSRRLVRLNLVTVTELLQRRYNATARSSGAVIMIAYALMVAVASIVACGTILHGLFGLPFWGGVLLGGGDRRRSLFCYRRHVVNHAHGHRAVFHHDSRNDVSNLLRCRFSKRAVGPP